MNPFSDRPTIQHLAGKHHELVSSMDYHEIPLDDDIAHLAYKLTRNYGVQIDSSVLPVTCGWVCYWVRIGQFDVTPEVEVDVVDLWQKFGSIIGSFTLSYVDLPSPMSLDPAAVSRAIGEIILPHLRRHCPGARLPEA